MTNDLHHGLGPTAGARIFRAVILMTLTLGGADCGGLPGKRGGVLGAQEVVYSERPATWFEDVGSEAQVSPDGRWALVGRSGQPRLIDLRSGQVDLARLRAGLDEVTFAVFRGDGLARLGRLGEQRGWFIEEGGTQRLLVGLPGDARPGWSPDGTRVAFSQRGVPAVFVGPLEAPARHDVSGRVTGLTWSAAGPTLYVTVWDDARGVSSLLQLAPDAPDLRTVAGSLDGEPFETTFAASDDGRRVLPGAGQRPDSPRRRPAPARQRPRPGHLRGRGGDRRAAAGREGPADDFARALAGRHLHFTHNDLQESVVALPAAGGLAELVAGGS